MSCALDSAWHVQTPYALVMLAVAGGVLWIELSGLLVPNVVAFVRGDIGLHHLGLGVAAFSAAALDNPPARAYNPDT